MHSRCRPGGINAVPITVEVQLMRRLPSITVVGYAHHTIRESTERIRSAIEASGFSFPAKKVVVNLAPAETPKVGSSLDLPIALAILQATGALKNSLNQYLFVGELGLTGEIRSTRGAIAFTRLAHTTQQTIVVAKDMARAGQCVPNTRLVRSSFRNLFLASTVNVMVSFTLG